MPPTAKLLANQIVADNLELLCAWLEAQMAQREQPGLSIGIVYDQQLVWARGFGYADLARKVPATPNTLYRIASITKLFTSTAILQLRDEGKVQLDDPLTCYLPWFQIKQRFPDAPPITLRHLLTHTSGLPREAAFPYWVDNEFPDIEAIRKYLPEQETALATEAKWKYSNLGLTLLGEVVSAVTGMPWADYIEQKILQPLGMENTFARTVPADHPQLAVGYGRRLRNQPRSISPHSDTNGIAPSANMTSCVEDLAKFAMLQLRDGPRQGKQVLRGASLREMQRVHWLNPDWSAGRGLGFYVWRLSGKTLAGHGGALQGYRTEFQVCPEDKVAVIVLTNADDGMPLLYVEKAFKWVAPAIVAAAAPKAKTAAAEPGWQRYLGKYRNVWGDLQVVLCGGELTLLDPSQPDPLVATARLVPVAEHTFRIESKENFGSDGELAVFQVDETGGVVSLKLGNTTTFPVEEW
ncbi:MAG: serine hydrolase [Chloroflexi bacterium]|nr:MAG: serine hydrolase [Chloroflexota bacterium]